jgi:hypothetical protein
MSKIELANGATLRTFPPPPADFKPLEAEERVLAAHGFPVRPTDPELLKRWEAALSRPFHVIEPTFRSMDYKRRRLPTALGRSEHAVETTDIWSGAVVHAPRDDPFRWVEGTWTVPDAVPPYDASDGVWYSASTWVGIDGIDGSGDVLQAGCDSDVMRFWGASIKQVNPWWEWYPAGSFWISNLSVSQGDTMSCVICVTEGSTTSAQIFLRNLTTGHAATFVATAPNGTSLAGNSAEWIVERLEVDTSTPELARFGEVYFNDAHAGTVGGALLSADSADTIDMVDATGEVISIGIIENARLVQVRYWRSSG